MPYNLVTLAPELINVAVHGYLSFQGGNVYQTLKENKISFNNFLEGNHHVCAVRQGNNIVFNDSLLNSPQSNVRLSNLQSDDFFKDAKDQRMTHFFGQENSDDCGFCAAWFIIYTLEWLLQNPNKNIKDLPSPKINPFTYIKTNANHRTRAPIAQTYLKLVFYSNCVGLSVNFQAEDGGYALPDSRVSTTAISLSSSSTSKDTNIIKNILSDLCVEHEVKTTEKEKFVAELLPFFLRDTNIKYENFILYRNIILYFLLYHFEDINQLVSQGKTNQLSYKNIVNIDKIEAKTFTNFGAKQGYEAYAKDFLKTIRLDKSQKPLLNNYPMMQFSSDHDLKAPLLHENEIQHYDSSGETSITAAQFNGILAKYKNTSRVRFFCCCGDSSSDILETLQECKDANITDSFILTKIAGDKNLQTLFRTGQGNSNTDTDKAILELHRAFYSS